MLQSVGCGTRILLLVCGNSSPEVASLHSDLPSESPEKDHIFFKISLMNSRFYMRTYNLNLNVTVLFTKKKAVS